MLLLFANFLKKKHRRGAYVHALDMYAQSRRFEAHIERSSVTRVGQLAHQTRNDLFHL